MATVWDEAEVRAGRVGGPGAGASGKTPLVGGWEVAGGRQGLAWSQGRGRLGYGQGSRLLHFGFIGGEAEAVSGIGGCGISDLS